MDRPNLDWLTQNACRTMSREEWDRRWNEYRAALVRYTESIEPGLLALYAELGKGRRSRSESAAVAR